MTAKHDALISRAESWATKCERETYPVITELLRECCDALRTVPALPAKREVMQDVIGRELDRAYEKHGRMPWSKHEFYAILLEEVDELWEAIRKDRPQEEVMSELIQVAAMCFRHVETCQ